MFAVPQRIEQEGDPDGATPMARPHLLQGVPGSGPRTAEALLDHFGSVRDVFNATEAQLLEVAGMHKNLIAKMDWLLSG